MINNRNSIMVDIIYDVINHDITKHLKEKEITDNKIPTNIVSKFYLGAVFNVGIEWLKNGSRYSKEEVLEYLNLLIPDNIN